jgi:hypothetical protein
VALLAGFALSSSASDSPQEASDPRTAFVLAPPADFYPQYVADPLRSQSAVVVAHAPSTEIPDSGNPRVIVRLGGRFGLVRWHPEGEPERGWQIDFEGGFFGHFDADHTLDNIGWDGLFGLTVSYKPTSALGIRLGRLHDSAHLGDEYVERTGRERIGYTREEIVLGVSWAPTQRWRMYAEAGHGDGGSELQQPWRFQVGAEHHGERRFFADRMGWYAAVDVRCFAERDWQPNTNAQLGLVLPTGRGTSRFRFAVELYSGRAVMGELSMHDETIVGLGWYFDL